MTLENKKPQQEEELQKPVEKGEEKETKLSPEQALLEAQRLAEEMEKNCQQMLERLSIEGEEVGISEEDRKDFEEKIRATLEGLDNLVKDYAEQIKKFKTKLSLLEKLPLASLKKEDIEQKILENEGNKGKLESIKNRGLSSLEKVRGKEQEIQRTKQEKKKKIEEEEVMERRKIYEEEQKREKKEREKKERILKTKGEMEQILLLKIHGMDRYGDTDFASGIESENNIAKLNSRQYELIKEAILDTQPEVAQEILVQFEKEKGVFEFKPSKELQELMDAYKKAEGSLEKKEKEEVLAEITKRYNQEKLRAFIKPEDLLKLVQENKVDMEASCENMAKKINILDTNSDFVKNSQENGYSFVMMPSMVVEKIVQNFGEDEINAVYGTAIGFMDEAAKVHDHRYGGYKKYKDLKSKADLYYGLIKHPQFHEVVRKATGNLSSESREKTKEYVAKIGDTAPEWLDSIRGSFSPINEKQTRARDEAREFDKIAEIMAELKKIAEKRKELLQQVKEEKEIFQQLNKEYFAAKGQNNFAEAIKILVKIEDFQGKMVSTKKAEEILKNIDNEENEKKAAIKTIIDAANKISQQRKEPSDIYNDFNKRGENEDWINQKYIDGKLKKGFDETSGRFVSRLNYVNEKAKAKELSNIQLEGVKDKTFDEVIKVAADNKYFIRELIKSEKEYHGLYNQAASELKKEMALPDIRWDWNNLRKIMAELYDKNFKEEHQELQRLRMWLQKNKSNPPDFGLGVLATEIQNPYYVEGKKGKAKVSLRKEGFNKLVTEVEERVDQIKQSLANKRRSVVSKIKEGLVNHYEETAKKLNESKKRKDKFLNQLPKEGNSRQLVEDRAFKNAQSYTWSRSEDYVYGADRIKNWLDPYDNKEISPETLIKADFDTQWDEQSNNIKSSKFRIIMEDDEKAR